MSSPLLQDGKGLISITTLARLMLGVRDKRRYDGDDVEFLEAKPLLLEAIKEKGGIHPIFHLQFCPDLEYTAGLDGKTHKGVWYLWNRTDWELDYAKQQADKERADKNSELFNDNKTLFNELCVGIAKHVVSKPEDELVKTLATIILKTKSKPMAIQYGVSEELMTKLWGK